MTRRLAIGLGTVLQLSAAPAALPAQTLSFNHRPTLTAGALRVDLTVRLQGDVREAPIAVDAHDVDFDLTRRRIGLKGTLSRHVEFEVEREVEATAAWRDAFVNVRTFRSVQVRAGRFKMPFSREQLTSASDLDFISRSRAADLLTPGRSIGTSVHGRIAGRVIGYDAGFFTRDGDAARFGTNPGAGATVAARLTVKPRRSARPAPSRPALSRPGQSRRASSIGDIEIGVGATDGDVPEGLHSLRGRQTSRAAFFSPVFVHGRRLRFGTDLDWRPGPFGIRAEFLRVDDQRRDQGVTGETLPALRAQGWYVTGTWAVAGRGAKRMADEHWAFAGVRGLELAVRAEQLSFGSVGHGEPDLRTPRAAHLATVTDRALTLGVNWSLNRLVRVQLNGVRERIHDASQGAPVSAASWARVCRVQVTL